MVAGWKVRAPQGAAQGDRIALFLPARLGRVPASSDQVLKQKKETKSLLYSGSLQSDSYNSYI